MSMSDLWDPSLSLGQGGLLGGYSFAAPQYHQQSLNVGTGESTWTNRATGEAEAGFGVSTPSGISYVGQDPAQDTLANRKLFEDALAAGGYASGNPAELNYLTQPVQEQSTNTTSVTDDILGEQERSLSLGGPPAGEEQDPFAGVAQQELTPEEQWIADGKPTFGNPAYGATPEERQRVFSNHAIEMYKDGETTMEQNEAIFGTLLDPNSQWNYTEHQQAKINSMVKNVAIDSQNAIHNAVGGNREVRTSSIDNWYKQVNEMGPNEQYLYFKNNPQWALRHNALAVKMGDRTPEENKAFAAAFTNDMGIPFDGAGTKNDPNALIQGSNNRYLVTDFSGRIDDDITKPYSPQDLLMVGTYQNTDNPSGLSQIVQQAGNLLAPFTAGLSPIVAGALRAAGGQTLHGDDYINIGTSAILGHLLPADVASAVDISQNAAGDIIYNLTATGAEIGVMEASDILTQEAIDAGLSQVVRGVMDGVTEGYEQPDPNAPYGDAQGPGGFFDLIVKENPQSYEYQEPVEEQGGANSQASTDTEASSESSEQKEATDTRPESKDTETPTSGGEETTPVTEGETGEGIGVDYRIERDSNGNEYIVYTNDQGQEIGRQPVTEDMDIRDEVPVGQPVQKELTLEQLEERSRKALEILYESGVLTRDEEIDLEDDVNKTDHPEPPPEYDGDTAEEEDYWPTDLPPGYRWDWNPETSEWDLSKTGGDDNEGNEGTGDDIYVDVSGDGELEGKGNDPTGDTTGDTTSFPDGTGDTGTDPTGETETEGTNEGETTGTTTGTTEGETEGDKKGDTNETPITQGLFSGTPYSFDRTDPWKNYSTGPTIRLGQNPLYPPDPGNPTIPRGMLTR